MMASSTTIPIERIRARRVRLLIEKSRKYITAKVAMIDAGIASPGMKVALAFRRKRKMISTTRKAGRGVVRGPRKEGAPGMPKEEKDDRHDQEGGEDEGLLRLLDRPLDVDRLVV